MQRDRRQAPSSAEKSSRGCLSFSAGTREIGFSAAGSFSGTTELEADAAGPDAGAGPAGLVVAAAPSVAVTSSTHSVWSGAFASSP